MISWNVNSWTQTNGELRAELIKIHEPHIICLQETKLLHDDKITLDGYRFYGNNRNNIKVTATCGSGGVALLVRNDIAEIYTISCTSNEFEGIISCRFVHNVSGMELLITSCYLPPEGSERGQDSADFFDYLTNAVYNNVNVDVMIFCGDVNARIGDVSDVIENIDILPTRINIDTVKNKHGDTFVEFLKVCKLCVLNGRVCPDYDNYTSISTKGHSVVDYVFVPQQSVSQFTQFKVLTVKSMCEQYNIKPTCKIPDHSLLLCDVTVDGGSRDYARGGTFNSRGDQRTNQVASDQDCPLIGKRFDYTRIPNGFLDSSEFRDLITKLETQIVQQDEINTIYSDICHMYYNELISSVNFKYVSNKNIRRHRHTPKEWWNDHLETLWRDVCRSEREYLKYVGPRRIKVTMKNDYIVKQRKFDTEVKRSKRKYRHNKHIEIETLQTDNPRKFWKHIKQLGPNKTTGIPMVVTDDNGNPVTDTNDVLKRWETEFQSLFNKAKASENANFDEQFYEEVLQFKRNIETHMEANNIEDDNNNNNNNVDNLNVPITETEVSRAIQNSKRGSAAGIDKLPYEVFKNDNSTRLLHKLFTKCFTSDLLPEVWSKAVIKPIPKNSTNDPRVPMNYRGISLLPTTSKLFTAVLNARLNTYLTQNDILVDEQNGFRRLRSCADHLFTLCSIIRNRKSRGKPTFACFIDMMKAFDRVDIDCLLSKLLTIGVQGHFYKTVKNLYNKPQSCVLLNDVMTDWFDVECGVKQGDIMSPTLFSIYVNDLALELKNMNLGIQVGDDNICILLYADDIVILAENEDNLQTMLNHIHNWCSKWRLKVNINKTNIVHFRKLSQQQTEFVFNLGDQILNKCSNYKYLGCILPYTLDFTQTAKTLADAAGRALGNIINKYKCAGGLPFSTYTRLYQACVVPVMDYAAGIWGFKPYQKCDTIQNRAIRAFLGVHKHTSNVAVNGDVGWISAGTRRKLSMIRLWARLTSMDDGRITKRVFKWDLEQSHGWCSDMKTLFQQLNLGHLYDDQSMGQFSLHGLLQHAETELHQRDITQWGRELQRQPKLRTYRLFKDDYKCENYVTLLLPKSLRSFVAQLRCGVLPLRVETGRFRNLPVEDRLCIFCDLNEVETEIHFCFVCPLYSCIRILFYNSIYRLCPEFMAMDHTNKLKVMFTDKRLIMKSALFIQNCYMLRREKLYV